MADASDETGIPAATGDVPRDPGSPATTASLVSDASDDSDSPVLPVLPGMAEVHRLQLAKMIASWASIQECMVPAEQDALLREVGALLDVAVVYSSRDYGDMHKIIAILSDARIPVLVRSAHFLAQQSVLKEMLIDAHGFLCRPHTSLETAIIENWRRRRAAQQAAEAARRHKEEAEQRKLAAERQRWVQMVRHVESYQAHIAPRFGL